MLPRNHVTSCLLVFLLLSYPRVSTHPGHLTDDSDDIKTIEVLMPDVAPQVESNMCKSVELNKTVDIVGFVPRAKAPTVHHILVYGCYEPGTQDVVWDCGEMAHNHDSNNKNNINNNNNHNHHHQQQHQSELRRAGTCAKGHVGTILYAWAMDAPELFLPPAVGFKVGPETKVRHLVVQVHYGNVTSFLPPVNNKDHSGVAFLTKSKSQPKQAGIYLMATGGLIPSFSTTYMEAACPFLEPFTIHPFAYRTHTHTHGKVVAGYRVRGSEWTEIGRKNPQLPQMFYNVTTPELTIKPGDFLASRCTMVNEDKEDIKIGSTSKDEMCNFYLMFYIDGNQTLDQSFCATPGFPFFRWKNYFDPPVAENIPSEASLVPETNTLYEESDAPRFPFDQLAGSDEDDDVNDVPYVNWKRNRDEQTDSEVQDGVGYYDVPKRQGGEYYLDGNEIQKAFRDLSDEYQY